MTDTEPRRICVVTGSRAEYGLLYWLLVEIKTDPGLSLQMIVTGSHLSESHGFTIDEIKQDGFKPDRCIDLALSGDSAENIAVYMSRCLQRTTKIFNELKSDIVLVLGDRYEIFAAAIGAMLAGKPIAHIHGGEVTEGSMDDSMRHSISKLSHLHFAASEVYARRLVQMGEQPDTVFNVGAIGLDNIEKLQLLDREEVLKRLNLSRDKKYVVVTYHPVTNHLDPAHGIRELLEALAEFPDLYLIFTGVNADIDGVRITAAIENFVISNSERASLHHSLGQLLYLSAMRHAAAVVGNSSSGIIEAPYLHVPTVNIGDRQAGRLMADSVVNCEAETAQIASSLRTVLDAGFGDKTGGQDLPYGTAGASSRIKDCIKSFPLESLRQKTFHDVNFS